MLVHSARRILDILHSTDSFLGAYGDPVEWDCTGFFRREDEEDEAWNEGSGPLTGSDESFANWYKYLEHLKSVDVSKYQGGNYYVQPVYDVPKWHLIQDPCIDELLLSDPRWMVSKDLLQKEWNPSAKHSRGHQCDDVTWEMSHAVEEIHHSIFVPTKRSPDLYVPKGLHIFKPLAPDLFGSACKELYRLYMDEDIDPSGFFSPDRADPGRIDNIYIEKKTMLVYTIEREREVDDVDYAFPQQTIGDTLHVLRDMGYSNLANFAEKHVHAMIALTGSSYEDARSKGGIMFLRYAPKEGFRPHIDGTSSLGHSPGPILNVTMGVEGAKVFDMMPATCWDDPKKKPIRITTKPGEGILIWGESRVAWTHCIPKEDNSWRYTMAIKLVLNEERPAVESTGNVASFEYENYKLNMRNVETVENSDGSLDVQPPADLVPISRCVVFDAKKELYRYMLPREFLARLNEIHLNRRKSSEYSGRLLDRRGRGGGGGRGRGGGGRGRGSHPAVTDSKGRRRREDYL